MKKKYRFRNSTFTENAQAVGEFFEKAFPHGNPKPHEIVEIAKEKDCVIHKYFDWDNESAAEKYRINQARQLIRCLYVEIDEGNEVRAYESILTLEDERSYLEIDRIASDQSLVDQVIETALKELNYWKLKYEKYKNHFPSVFEAVTKDLKGVSHEEEVSRRTNNPNPANRNKDRQNYSSR